MRPSYRSLPALSGVRINYRRSNRRDLRPQEGINPTVIIGNAARNPLTARAWRAAMDMRALRSH